MDLTYVISTIISLIGIFLLILTYTYIDKLEKIGCSCAEHKYRKFIKTFSLVAVAFLAITTLIPPAFVAKSMGATVGSIYAFLSVPFFLAMIVFYVLALVYVRYLMKEKCKCSEDVRREILYFWSILEIIFIAALFIFPILMAVIGGSVAVVANTIEVGEKRLPAIRTAVVDPVNSAVKMSKSVKKSLRKMRK